VEEADVDMVAEEDDAEGLKCFKRGKTDTCPLT